MGFQLFGQTGPLWALLKMFVILLKLPTLMSGSCHIQSVQIGAEYRNWRRTLDVYLLFAILLGQIY